jgi:GH24 family phage-related lysozyme (muramidase)
MHKHKTIIKENLMTELLNEIRAENKWQVWLSIASSEDSKLCDKCKELHGRIDSEMSDFWESGVKTLTPPLHDYCRCKRIKLSELVISVHAQGAMIGTDYLATLLYGYADNRNKHQEAIIWALRKLNQLRTWDMLNKIGALYGTGANSLQNPLITSVSSKLIEFIAGWESFRATAYYATSEEKARGIQTIGYGHVLLAGEKFTSVSRDEALTLLETDIVKHIPDYFFQEMAEKKVRLNQNQFDALVSLCYNVGYGTLQASQSPQFRKILLNGKWSDKDIETQFLSYSSAAGKQLSGLVLRRQREANMFNYGEYNSEH